MAKFRFRLEPLLEQRRQVERDRQRRVAEIQRQVNELLGRINDAQQRISTENRTLAGERLMGRLDMSYIANEKRFVGSLQLLIMQTMQRLAVTQQAMDEARAALLEAAKARKALERLREKQFARWREEEARKEAAALDEIGTQLAVGRMLRGSAQQAAGSGRVAAEELA